MSEPSKQLRNALAGMVTAAAEALVADGGVNPASQEEVIEHMHTCGIEYGLRMQFNGTAVTQEWKALSRAQQDALLKELVDPNGYVL